MYSHERTMLAKLGFADPDRREPLHDLACRYLATPDAVRRLIQCLAIERGPEPHSENSSDYERVSCSVWKVASHQCQRECEIAKGLGQYRTTIGFADLVVQLQVEQRHCDVRRRTRNVYDERGHRTWTPWQAINDEVWKFQETVGIEAKVTPGAISDVIRQVKLYRSYSGIRRWVVATTFPLMRPELECLANEELQHVQLGSYFQAFVASQSASEPVVNTEV